jgi:RNA polymerase sigma-70 factor, ECF subfamily
VTVEGRAAADVAFGLDISVNAVWLARQRVVKRLREELDGLLE